MIKYKELIGEKEVEHFWWSVLETFFPNCSVEARDTGKKTDGLLIDEDNKIRTLIEVKDDLEMTKSLNQAKVLIQSIFYIKKYEKDGVKLPKTIFIADKNEAFIVHTNSILKYLDYDINWNTAPSQAHKSQPQMLLDISNDESINPFVFDITYDKFNFNAIKNKLIDLNQNVKRLIKITDNNLQQIFEYFIKNVLGKNKLTINEQVNLFIDLLINPNDNYLHPRKKNTITTKSLGFLKVNEKNFINFFNHFDGEQYTVREKEQLVSIIDRLIEDETRKRQGEFFTPRIWVDEAHKMISDEFGSDWKEKYVVWDCAWGTGNLTKDYKFKELYCSTLHQSDIDTASQMGLNPESVKFRFDFLNDDLELLKEPEYAPGLYKAIKEGEEILFLINPPYKRVSDKSLSINHSSTSTSTKVSKSMKNMGNSVEQLYTQFLYKISLINNTNIAIFSPQLYKTGSSLKDFRNYFYTKYKCKNSMSFKASHFADVSKEWAIDFSIWCKGIEKRSSIPTKIKDIDDIEIKEYRIKNLYNLDKSIKMSEWVRLKTKNKNTIDLPQLTSGLNISNIVKKRSGKMLKNALGYFFCASNNIEKNNSNVTLFSTSYSGGIGLSIIKQNIFDVFLFFTSRKLISGKYATWINGKDEYIAPTEEVQNTIKYKQFNNDAIVYSLFQSNSNQSSLRQIEYKEKLWDIKNEFFWLSKEEMMDLSEEYYFDELYKDAKKSDERFVYKLLSGKLSEEEFNEVGLTYVDENNKPILSPDAQELLDLSKELIKKSFEFRKMMNDEYSEYHLNTWDAGWYQMKKVLNEYFKDDYKVFVEKYKAFENRLRPQVYEFGMLLK